MVDLFGVLAYIFMRYWWCCYCCVMCLLFISCFAGGLRFRDCVLFVLVCLVMFGFGFVVG